MIAAGRTRINTVPVAWERGYGGVGRGRWKERGREGGGEREEAKKGFRLGPSLMRG